MHFDFRHMVMPLSHDTGYSDIDVDHDSHWNEKRAHCGEHYIAFVLIITAFPTPFDARVIVPVFVETREIIWYLLLCTWIAVVEHT